MTMAHHSHGSNGSSSTSSATLHPQARSPLSHLRPSPSQPAETYGMDPGVDNIPSIPMHHLQGDQFDILEWYPHFQSCQCYFMEHGQFTGSVQALAAFLNIQLPFQMPRHLKPEPSPISSSASPLPSPQAWKVREPSIGINNLKTVTPYIRRLVVTGSDTPEAFRAFFGDGWVKGIGRLHEIERQNYLFATKSSCWLDIKRYYDEAEGQTVPFLLPLRQTLEEELSYADSHWSEWLAMQDWLVGPRSLEDF